MREGVWIVIGVSTWNYYDVQVGAVTPDRKRASELCRVWNERSKSTRWTYRKVTKLSLALGRT